MADLKYLEGRKICVVFVKTLAPEHTRIQLRCFRGRGDLERGQLNVVAEDGQLFTVPGSAMPSLQPNDGTKILGDAEYYVLVHADSSIDFV